MQLFFAENLESDVYTLPPEESKHCVRVLRMAKGDRLALTDGSGTLAWAEILDPDSRACSVLIVERLYDYGKRPFRLHVAVAPTKNTARLEWFVEKAVEMGVDVITPVLCDHSERCVLKRDRLEKIVISAMKQSLKTYLPVIEDLTPLSQLLQRPFDGQRFVAYCDGDHRTPLREAYTPGNDALILIGPEGDFSSEEVEKALSLGFTPVTLGECRLRTETAALAATAFFNLVN